MLLHLALQIVAVTHTTLIDPATGGERRDVTIISNGTRISAIGPTASTKIPAGAREVAGRGRFVIPGLWDMHVHMSVPSGRELLSLYVVNGVTGVRDMNDELTTLRAWQREVLRGELPGPRMVMSGPYLEGGPVPIPYLLVRNGAEATRAVDSLAALHVDFVKVHNRLNAEAFFAALRAARQKGLVVAGHINAPVTPMQAADSGLRSLEHLYGFPNECTKEDSSLVRGTTGLVRYIMGVCTNEPQEGMYRELARRTVWQTPTLITLTELAALRADAPFPNDSLAHYASDSLKRLWRMMMELPANPSPAHIAGAQRLFEKRIAMTGALHRAGVHLLAGTDAPSRASVPGWSLHDELALFVRAGLSPIEALRTATTEPGRYFATDTLGRVAPGAVADYVVLDADPRINISNTRKIFAVVANGRLYDSAARTALLAKVRQAASH